MSAGIYDANGKPLMKPRNVMTELNMVADTSQEAFNQMVEESSANAPYSMTTPQPESQTKFFPATERAIQESQLAVQREMEKKIKLDKFRKKTIQAARNYGQSLKSETQIKEEKMKKEAEIKLKKKKEFEQKLKEMRKNMKTKPKTAKNDKNKATSRTTEKTKNSVAVKVHGKGGQVGQNKENMHSNNRANYNTKIKKPFGSTSIVWGTSSEVGKDQKFQYPTYFPVTDCVNHPQKGVESKERKESKRGVKPGSKLAQITATSVAIPFNVPDTTPMMEKSSSIEISMDKHNFEYSSNLHSKVSGPLRESELLNANHRQFKQVAQDSELENAQRYEFIQSQEKRLPLSKISGENSGFQAERVTNGINGWENNLNEVPEDITVDYINQDIPDDCFQDFGCEEPIPKGSIPAPQPMIDYKAVRDQKKWEKVNSALGMF